ncbi:MAG: hypothetical protein M1378_03015, partial [Bacteroidetes bacterium]|nr:hypothetical protein [Bacteroidota bacterium]
MEVRDIIRQISDSEPLNPYQIAGMTAVISRSGVKFGEGTRLAVDGLTAVLMILDRAGEEASPYLVDLRQTDSQLTLFSRFPRESLEELIYLTSFEGRRMAIRENLIPALYEIPNWLEVVHLISRYSLDRDEESLADHLSSVMEILFNYLFAAVRQPFDPEARSEAEYVLCRLVANILNLEEEKTFSAYQCFVESALDFMAQEPFRTSLNSFDRRVLEVSEIRSALKKRSDGLQRDLMPRVDRMAVQALVTALGEIRACPDDLVQRLQNAVEVEAFEDRQRFRKDILERIGLHSAEEIEKRRQIYQGSLDGSSQIDEEEITRGVSFIRSLTDEWRAILSAFQDMIDTLPMAVQEAFAGILAAQILSVDKPEVKDLFIDGLCRIVVRLEKTKKQASRDLVDTFANVFLERAYSSEATSEVVSSLKALESLGVTLGRAGYFLMAQELIDHLVRRPLIQPLGRKYTIEDDDTGEPLVLAEETGANQAHVQHVKCLISITED